MARSIDDFIVSNSDSEYSSSSFTYTSDSSESDYSEAEYQDETSKTRTFEKSRGKQIRMMEDGAAVYGNGDEDNQNQATQHFVLDQEDEIEIQAEEIVKDDDVVEVQPTEPEEIPENTFLGQLELLWTSTFLSSVLLLLKVALKRAMTERDLTSKRAFSAMTDLWKDFLMKYLHGEKNRDAKLSKKCSWRTFVKSLYDGELYTMFFSLKLTPKTLEILQECAETLHTPEASCSSPRTGTTSMSSTTVPTPAVPAETPSLIKSEEDGDFLGKLFGLGNTQLTTGSIQQSISTVKNGRLYSAKSPGESGMTLVKLETYPIRNIAGLDKNMWWKQADIRMMFIVSSIADPKHLQVQKLIQSAVKDIESIPGIEKSERQMTSTNSYYGYRPPQ